MAYATEANAGFRISAFTFNAVSALSGRIRFALEKMVGREVLQADTNNTPTSRPLDTLDCRCTLDALDQAGGLSHAVAAAACVASYTEGNGGAATITFGNMLPGTIRHNWGRHQGGFGVSQDLELEGALTYTPTS